MFNDADARNPYRHLLDDLDMLPGGGDARGIVRLVFAWSEAQERVMRCEQALAGVESALRCEMDVVRSELLFARVRVPNGASVRELERQFAHLSESALEWRLGVARADLERARAALDEADAALVAAERKRRE